MSQAMEDQDEDLDVVGPLGNDIDLENFLDEADKAPMINIVLPNDPNTNNPVAPSLFIRKLWKMVNDEDDEIIGWNNNGDAFFIHDQIELISKLLPAYFKHNNISSFVRQLNLYDFQKVPSLKKDVKSELQFSHPFFLKDYPQLLPLIKRKKVQATQSKPTKTKGIEELVQEIEEMKKKQDKADLEVSKLTLENSALWREMNSLQMKYTKQSKIINKLIHFLISYMQKNPSKRPRTVNSTMKPSIGRGPQIMELDYRYKNNPSEFWNEFDSQQTAAPSDASGQGDYIVTEPDHCDVNMEATTQEPTTSTDPGNLSSDISTISTVQATNFPENVYNFIENPQVEMSTIKELFKNLSGDDMVDFYKLVNENYKNQESESTLTTDTNENAEEETFEKEVIGLNKLTRFAEGLTQDSLVPMDISPSRSNPNLSVDNPEFNVDQYLNLEDWN